MQSLVAFIKKNLLLLVGFALPLALYLGYLALPPSFPADLPSAENSNYSSENYLAQNQFFTRFTSYLRQNHGNLLLTKEIETQESRMESEGSAEVSFLLQLKKIDEDLLLDISNRFSKQEAIGYKVRKIKLDQNQASEQVELIFFQDQEIWVRILLVVGTQEPYYQQLVRRESSPPPEADESPSPANAEPDPAPKAVLAAAPAKSQPSQALARMVLVMDDLGNSSKAMHDLLKLQFAITFSILPQLPHSTQFAQAAHQAGKETLLHLPMEPLSYPKANPGAGALLLADSPEALVQKLEADLESTPFVAGVNNHMGSALVQDQTKMDLIMRRLAIKKLFYLDSKTAPGQVAQKAAASHQVPYLPRNFFLDNVREEKAIQAQLAKGVEIAKKRGASILIGHPYPETMAVLKASLPGLADQGVKLVTLKELFSP